MQGLWGQERSFSKVKSTLYFIRQLQSVCLACGTCARHHKRLCLSGLLLKKGSQSPFFCPGYRIYRPKEIQGACFTWNLTLRHKFLVLRYFCVTISKMFKLTYTKSFPVFERLYIWNAFGYKNDESAVLKLMPDRYCRALKKQKTKPFLSLCVDVKL
jgi:hypothetical protein